MKKNYVSGEKIHDKEKLIILMAAEKKVYSERQTEVYRSLKLRKRVMNEQENSRVENLERCELKKTETMKGRNKCTIEGLFLQRRC